MRFIGSLLGGLIALCGISAVQAQTLECNSYYTIEDGDTLEEVSNRVYGETSKYTLIYYSNRGAIGENPSLIRPGVELWLPCIRDETTVAAVAPSASEDAGGSGDSSAGSSSGGGFRTARADISVLTGSDYRPFTDQGWEEGGLTTEIVRAALNVGAEDLTHRIVWVNDWASHLSPLLSEKHFDMGFPWIKPPEELCEDPERLLSPAMRPRCAFLWSEPMFEILVPMFGRTDTDLQPRTVADLEGRSLCRPAGYYTFDLEARGLKPPAITMMQPPTPADCFRMMLSGEVDFVTINEFTGRDTIKALGIEENVQIHDEVATLQGFHMVIHKTHPRGHTMIHRFNRGLRELRESGEYDQIVAKHLSLFYGLGGSS